MNHRVLIKPISLAIVLFFLGGCATRANYDYSAFRQSRPASILVLPPLNSSPDVNATYSVLAQTSLPLAESGYYVFPVSLVDETFKQNGMTSPSDIHQIPITKLRDIFGADAALYLNVKQYGSSYTVVMSETRVTVEGSLVDIRTGKTLWAGAATASSAEGQGNSGGGLVGMLVKAVIVQIVESLSDKGHPIAGIASYRLLGAGKANGILYGPRSPMYMKEGLPTP